MKKILVALVVFMALMTFNACGEGDSSTPLVEVSKKQNVSMNGLPWSSLVRITALDNDIQILEAVGNRGNLSLSCGGETLQFGQHQSCHFSGSVDQLKEV